MFNLPYGPPVTGIVRVIQGWCDLLPGLHNSVWRCYKALCNVEPKLLNCDKALRSPQITNRSIMGLVA
jgi:hypothetical protein